jgi:hypothetical protein
MAVIYKNILQQRTKRLLSENKNSRHTVSYTNAQTIGVLFTQSTRNKYQAIRNLTKQFKNDGKQVEVLCYLEKGAENYDFLYDYITSNDVGLWGKMQSPSALKFAQQTFDYLFYLDLKENIYLENVLAMSKASCRIGFYKRKNDDLLDLMLNFNGKYSIGEAIDQILFYTRKLGSDGK